MSLATEALPALEGGSESRPLRILLFAYACEPDEGSEPGAGWMWARLLTRFGSVSVLTRANNRQAIDKRLPDLPERDRLRIEYLDLPAWMRFWKRGQRGIRLYYLAWQVKAVFAARRLAREDEYDLVWHLTLANGWLGSLAPLAGGAFVYGPIGGGAKLPWRLVPTLGLRGAAHELVRTTAQTIGRFANPLARLAWSRARLILVQNPATREWLPSRHRGKVVVLPNVILDDPTRPRSPSLERNAIVVSRLLPWKGVALAVRAVHAAPGWRLTICGTGPDEHRLRRLTSALGIDDRVRFLGQAPRSQVLLLMEEANALLFPSLHDDAGWVAAEAASRGLPVVCLELGGPPFIAGRAAVAVSPHGGASAVVRRLADALERSAGMDVVADPERFQPESVARKLDRLLIPSLTGVEA